MPDITVEPAALRAAAARIEQSLAALEAARDRLAGAPPGPAVSTTVGTAVGTAASPPAAVTELLRRSHADLLADQHAVLAGLAGALRADAGRLRQAADRYQDTECQNTVGAP
jgi:hypothetical protein